MAAGGERRMVFDTRGRRKHVIRVVYAILALLMGGSLFLVVGPVNIGALFGNSATTSAAGVLDEQSERIEHRLARDPTNEAMLLALTRARISAANAQLETDPSTGVTIIPTDAAANYKAGLSAWRRYLEQAGDEPSPTAAQLVAGTYFSSAESGAKLPDIESNLRHAAETQQIVALARPSVGSLSTLAIYEYFDGDFNAGDKATKQATAHAPSKTEVKGIEKQLAEYRKRGKEWEKQKAELAKQQQKRGKEALQNPLGGLSGSGTP
jgi:hypothetical protein